MPASEITSYTDKTVYTDTKPAFSGQGFVLTPEPVEITLIESPIYEHMLLPWNPNYYQVPREPIAVGEIPDPQNFSRQVPEVARIMSSMPIKLPGMDTYNLPVELEQFSGAMQMIINYEATINPRLKRDYFAYISTHQSLVLAQTTQRQAGAHVDGLQIGTYPATVPPEQVYVLGDSVPTTFYPGQTIDFTGIDPTPQAYSKAVRQQVSHEGAVAGVPNMIYLFDSYTPHSPSLATEDTFRTFIRMEFSPRDNRGPDVLTGSRSTPNPLFVARQARQTTGGLRTRS